MPTAVSRIAKVICDSTHFRRSTRPPLPNTGVDVHRRVTHRKGNLRLDAFSAVDTTAAPEYRVENALRSDAPFNPLPGISVGFFQHETFASIAQRVYAKRNPFYWLKQ